MWALETLGILALPLLVARFLIVFEADQGRAFLFSYARLARAVKLAMSFGRPPWGFSAFR